MLTENDLRELVDFNAPAPVLSLYLNTDPSQGNADAHKLRARSMIKDINLPQDVEAINRYLDHEYKLVGRGVAIFSCAPAGFLSRLSLGRARAQRGPYQRPAQCKNPDRSARQLRRVWGGSGG